MANRPDFIQSTEYRRQCLDELSYLRELRHKSKQRLLALASNPSHFRGDSTELLNVESLPPPPLGNINACFRMLPFGPEPSVFLSAVEKCKN
jgi:hypothetical protein